MKSLIAILAVTTAVMGCATSPGQVKPIAISNTFFLRYSCEELAAMADDTAEALAREWEQQGDAATGDALGVFLIGIPVSSTGGGDVEHALAQHLGEAEAIDRVSDQKDCGFDFNYPDTIIEHREKKASKKKRSRGMRR